MPNSSLCLNCREKGDGASDFVVDALERWWEQRSNVHAGVKRIQINLDNGPEISSARTQFMNRLVQFADRTGLEIELVY